MVVRLSLVCRAAPGRVLLGLLGCALLAGATGCGVGVSSHAGQTSIPTATATTATSAPEATATPDFDPAAAATVLISTTTAKDADGDIVEYKIYRAASPFLLAGGPVPRLQNVIAESASGLSADRKNTAIAVPLRVDTTLVRSADGRAVQPLLDLRSNDTFKGTVCSATASTPPPTCVGTAVGDSTSKSTFVGGQNSITQGSTITDVGYLVLAGGATRAHPQGSFEDFGDERLLLKPDTYTGYPSQSYPTSTTSGPGNCPDDTLQVAVAGACHG